MAPALDRDQALAHVPNVLQSFFSYPYIVASLDQTM